MFGKNVTGTEWPNGEKMRLYVFARKINQQTQIDFSSQSYHYESGGSFSAENVDLLCWGYDPTGKP